MSGRFNVWNQAARTVVRGRISQLMPKFGSNLCDEYLGAIENCAN